MSANFRPIFSAIYNQYAPHPKTAVQLWPLSIDVKAEKKEINIDELKALYRKIADEYSKN